MFVLLSINSILYEDEVKKVRASLKGTVLVHTVNTTKNTTRSYVD